MEFSLNLACILSEMGNEYDETFEDLGIDWREVARMIVRGEIELEVKSTPIGDYLVIEVPDELIKEKGMKNDR